MVEHIGNDQKWTFDDPGERGNNTGGTGGFAILDSDLYGYDFEYEGRQDTELTSPVVDLTGVAEPAIGFNSDFTMWDYDKPSGIGEVGLSGELRLVGQMPARLREAEKLGFKQAIVPRRLRRGEPWPSDIQVVEVRSLRQALEQALLPKEVENA